MDDQEPQNERPLEGRHFVAMAALRGNHGIDPAKEVVHRMQPGQTIYLASKYDTWVPNELEPFHDQVDRVFLAPAYAKFRDESRRQRALESLKSHLYRERMERVGLEKYIQDYDDGVIV